MSTNRMIALALAPMLLLSTDALAQLPPDDQSLLLDYSQWKLASGGGKLAEPVAIAARPGFQVEMLRAAEAGEGSWISLAFDHRGRLLVGREDKGILRFAFSADAKRIEKIEPVNDTLLEPRGLLVAHDSLYVTANNSKGLYRLRDADGDDRYEQVDLLQQLEGGVGHGRNGMALGPDGKIYIACGNNVKIPGSVDLAKSPYRNFAVDRLLPCAWNEFLFDSDVTPPAGFVIRCDAEGKNWELVAGGFRNPYDLAFNADGELFTYDADMEWDVGAPWYRPTTVIHVVPGGEYGWRQGTNVWPDHFPDALPRVVDVGLGSPTGVAFGEKSRFPSPYCEALFILDWAYGRILAVHLTPKGASYTGRVETFLRGKPLNVTDVVFGPDGAMYFTVGGRGTRSALYRVTHPRRAGDVNPPVSPVNDEPAQLRQQRRALEPLLTSQPTDALEKIWPGLTSADPFIRHTARMALENQGPIHEVKAMDPLLATNMSMAWVRFRDANLNDDALALLESQLYASNQVFREQVFREALRGIQVSLIRFGVPSRERKTRLIDVLEARFPAQSWPENQLLMELLVFLESEKAVPGGLSLIPKAENDQQRLFYLYALRLAKNGWTLDRRREYLKWLKASEKFAGAHYLPRFLTYIRTDALAGLSDEERTALAGEIDELGRMPGDSGVNSITRLEVKKWTVDELLAAVGAVGGPPDLARGKRVYAEAQCIRCHRHGGEGVPYGPDLDHVSARFGVREILDATINPSRSIDDKYRTLLLETSEGKTASGFLVGGDAENYYVAADPLRPTTFQRIGRKEISSRTTSPLSPMPEGLLNTFTAAEIYDLLAYLGAISAAK